MPELPEIETIKRGLEPKLTGRTIIAVDRFDVAPAKQPHGQFHAEGGSVEHDVIGAEINAVRRQAKVLLVDLNSGHTLIFHLKMTGQLVLIEPAGDRFGGGHPTESMRSRLPDTTTRTIFTFDDGSRLFFNDQRKFGWIKLVASHKVQGLKFFKKVGPEPFSEDFSRDYFWEVIKGRRAPIKALLLAQETVAGIGNIYADEALHLAQIHPARTGSDLGREEADRLHSAVRTVMKDSIERGGTSFTNYVNHLGLKGDYLKHARVFRREGKACLECGTKIVKTKVAGRGTHVCPQCQVR